MVFSRESWKLQTWELKKPALTVLGFAVVENPTDADVSIFALANCLNCLSQFFLRIRTRTWPNWRVLWRINGEKRNPTKAETRLVTLVSGHFFCNNNCHVFSKFLSFCCPFGLARNCFLFFVPIYILCYRLYVKFSPKNKCPWTSVAEPDPGAGGFLTKLLPGARAVLTNHGSGSLLLE